MNDKILRDRARSAVFQILDAPCALVGEPISIRDVTGPVIFADYLFETSTGIQGWVRTFPDGMSRAETTVISVHTGPHPSLKRMAQSISGADRAMHEELHQRTILQKYVAENRIASLGPSRRLERSFTSEWLDHLVETKNADDSIYCYHYPSIGRLAANAQSGELAFIDIQDGSIAKVTESGEETEPADDRRPYSALAFFSELGPPGPVAPPHPSHTVQNVPLYGQLKSNWCSAASCQMLLAFHGVLVAQGVIAAAMNIPPEGNGGASASQQIAAYREFSNNLLNSVLDLTPTAQECVDELASGRPVKVGIVGHAQVCAGWRSTDQGIMYLIHDPLPVGSGERKWQNPAVIYSINHITARSAG